MGCLPSRSTTVAPTGSSNPPNANDNIRNNKGTATTGGFQAPGERAIQQSQDNFGAREVESEERGMTDRLISQNRQNSREEENMSVNMNDSDPIAIDRSEPGSRSSSPKGNAGKTRVDSGAENGDEMYNQSSLNQSLERESAESPSKTRGDKASFDDDLNIDLLRQYVAIDHEISQLEDKDALRIYHEKIEQLEMLERELDLISLEAEEVAARGGSGLETRLLQGGALGGGPNNAGGAIGLGSARANDLESNSLASGATGSISANSSLAVRQVSQQRNETTKKANGAQANSRQQQQQQQRLDSSNADMQTKHNTRTAASSMDGSRRFNKKSSYSTVEEVFNRKIILEKERDKLKKEVEAVIVECDKLQQRYKKRDDILDKLFDGRAGNGLENHLEQQLNWLLEQKHYVDQVFYAWKRAETLTSRTCEQLASAIELLKKLPDIPEDEEQRIELTRSICDLLKASRQDMEQAQKYNPNVDAPFLTEAETKRFDKIINTISSGSVKSSDYGQISTVIQFAYKRAASIKLWLEQILQITIARDSFELAEEYKWIAIQLRKERITLIKTKLQESPYRSIVRSVQEQLAANQQQQQQQQQQKQQQLMTDSKRTNEINRDSGVESDDIDIEEEIYRLLELNKERLEGAANRQQQQQQANQAASGAGAAGSTGNRTGVAQSNGLYGNGSGSGSGGATDRLQLVADQGRRMQLAAGQSRPSQQQQQQQSMGWNGGAASGGGVAGAGAGNSWTPNREQAISERIERRMRGEKGLETADALHPSSLRTDSSSLTSAGNDVLRKAAAAAAAADAAQATNQDAQSASQLSSATLSQLPSKLKVELDEAAKQDLLKQVTQIHARHRSRMEIVRGNNKAKATDSILSRMEQAGKRVQGPLG